MSSGVYEKIGRRVVELYSQNAEFAKQPNKGTDGKKPKCKPTSHSCGFACISGKKTCRISMTMEQQQAAKALKKELKATKKAVADVNDPTGGNLGQMLLEVDRIGNKYQTPEEIEAFQKEMADLASEIGDIIDRVFDDSNLPPEVVKPIATEIKREVPKAYKKAVAGKTPEQVAASKAKLEALRAAREGKT